MFKRDLYIWKSPLTLFRRSGRRWDGISTGRRIESKWADGWSQDGHSNWWSGFHGRVRAICSTPWIYSRIIKWNWNEIVCVCTCFGSVCVWANMCVWNGGFSEFHVVEIWESSVAIAVSFCDPTWCISRRLVCLLSLPTSSFLRENEVDLRPDEKEWNEQQICTTRYCENGEMEWFVLC